MTLDELKNNENLSSKELFSHTHDYVKFTEVASNFPSIQEISVDSQEQFMRMLSIIEENDNAIALFLKRAKGFLDIITNPAEMEVTEDCNLVYLGKPMDFEAIVNAAKGKKR